MKRIIYKGQESKASSWLTDYLYEEFGIVMMGVQKLPSDMPVLDFGIQEWGSRKLSSSSGGSIKYEVHNLRKGKAKAVYISSAEILKFLDIAVKNGYNTKVN